MEKIIKELNGHSGSRVFIIKNSSNQTVVRKIGNTARNLERIRALSLIGLTFPLIYSSYNDSYDMEYIQNVDMKTFLSMNGIDSLVDYIETVFETLQNHQVKHKDYTETYQNRLAKVDFKQYNLNFSANDLIDRLPKILPCTEYHGDLTLENILYNIKTQQFVLIDPITTEYDSYIFDMAKLRQDLVCGWFIRNHVTDIQTKITAIDDRLKKHQYYDDSNILILMLLRVLPYLTDKSDVSFLTERINQLWK